MLDVEDIPIFTVECNQESNGIFSVVIIDIGSLVGW
jgi:hypothetical protein